MSAVIIKRLQNSDAAGLTLWHQLCFPLAPPWFFFMRPCQSDSAIRQYLFEDFALDTDQRGLRRGPTIVRVAPLAFDHLEFLIRNRERVLTRDDLIASGGNAARLLKLN